MCLYPKLIKNRKYTLTKKNGGNIPEIKDERVKYVPIGCTRCVECRKQKSREWQVRLLEDIKTHTNGKFVTMTFSNKSIKELREYEKTYVNKETKIKFKQKINILEGYELDNEIATVAIRLFMERWRKKYKTSIRHWLVTELGGQGTENIHLHGIIWTNESLEEVEKIWKYGYMWKGENINGKITNYVNEKTVGYITKYVSKMDINHSQYKSKILTSPGIGHDYTETYDSRKNQYNERKTIETYRTTTGHKIALPIYWRNKIFSEQEREMLWLYRLDKEERWVMGIKIDVSKTYEHYNNALKYYQQKNKELGYGDQEIDWSRHEYERQRRRMMYERRIQEKYRIQNYDDQQNVNTAA